jgi:hypothetical protein
MRLMRIVWPELLFGLVWLVLIVLGRTLYTDDEMWQHAVIDGLQWLVFLGYASSAVAVHRRSTAQSSA